jgi:hypothetical protein
MQPTATQQKIAKFFLILTFLFLTACSNSVELSSSEPSNNSSSDGGSSDGGSGNSAPIATAQSITTDEDTAKSIIISATSSNNDSLTYAIIDQPKKGTLTGNPPSLTYTPKLNKNGTDSFTFRVSDGSSDSVSNATVSITLTPKADLSISDASVTEGNAGETTLLVFKLTLDS